MIILDFDCQHQANTHRVVLIFGLGLIGASIFNSIKNTQGTRIKEFEYSWVSPALRVQQTITIRSYISDIYSALSNKELYFDVVWSAGRAGFASSEEDLLKEEGVFFDVLNMSWLLAGSTQFVASGAFHLLSSAGGLFEGQRQVNSSSVPMPLRPYGFLKMRQEKLLAERGEGFCQFIYRPSSVYGYSSQKNRVGVIVALIQNTFWHRTSKIYGSMDTLRDYVFSDDVGGFIAEKIVGRSTECQGGEYILASGKPTSIAEIIPRIEKVLHSKPYLEFLTESNNILNNTYSKKVIPKGFKTTPLHLGVYKTAQKVVKVLQ